MTEVGENTVAPMAGKGRFLAPGRPTIVAFAVAGLVVLLIVGLFFLSKNAPPRAARLLPESDGIIYIDASPMRAATHFDAHPVKHDPDYQAFIDATGIEFERDLNQAALATHLMANPLGPNGPVAFSSIFVGKFDRQRLADYLASKAQSQEHYGGHDIYNIAVEGRTDRVVILDSQTVAVSNAPTAEQIHSILDRQRTAFLPFSGNSLLAQHYKEVPLFSLAWGMGKLAAGMGDDLNFFGLRIPLSVDAMFIGSLRWTGALRLRIEEIAPNGRRSHGLRRLHRGIAQRCQDRRERTAERRYQSRHQDSTRQRGNRAPQRPGGADGDNPSRPAAKARPAAGRPVQHALIDDKVASKN